MLSEINEKLRNEKTFLLNFEVTRSFEGFVRLRRTNGSNSTPGTTLSDIQELINTAETEVISTFNDKFITLQKTITLDFSGG